MILPSDHTSVTSKSGSSVGAPVVGGFLAVAPHPNVKLAASLVGFTWDADDVDITAYDFNLSGHLVLRPGVTAGLGYRNLSVDGEDTDDGVRFDLSFSGPVVFLGAAF